MTHGRSAVPKRRHCIISKYPQERRGVVIDDVFVCAETITVALMISEILWGTVNAKG
jgi:hypothetical protein